MSLLEIENLSLAIGPTQILRGVSLSLQSGEVLGIVGESGSGKSMTALSVMRLLPPGARTHGRIALDGTDILRVSEHSMCRLRGNAVGMVFQEPMTALNPVKTIGEQVAEGIRWHTGANRADAEDKARAMLDRVGLPVTRFPLSRFPHQLSGGQRQRVVIAMACALKPRLLIADEPTTALDVVLQQQILDLLRDLVHENRMGMLLISHDLAVVTDMADQIAIMREGVVVERGDAALVLSQQSHPYTRQLALASMHVPERPRRHGAAASGHPPPHTPAMEPDGQPPPLLSVEAVKRDYAGARLSLLGRAPSFRAVDDVSFTIEAGHSVALVGRSGCGKSTLARIILALDQPTSGTVRFQGERVSGRRERDIRAARRNMQVVFQDPYGSFDPRQRVERLVTEPLNLLDEPVTDARRRDLAAAALNEVGLSQSDLDKYAHEFSGGQRQRLSIARALITRPKLIVADEPVSALDVSIRAHILDLFAALNDRLGIAFLFITHDLTVARAITDRLMVMDEGRIVEEGQTARVLDSPATPAARALVNAAPDLRRSMARRLGEQG